MVAPSIEGTYQLVRRELPDGTVQLPPAVKGMITYTKEFRNFSVVWKDDQGRFYSECYVARYTLTDQEYLIVDDQIGDKGISYDLSNTTAKSPVSIDGGASGLRCPSPSSRRSPSPWNLTGPHSVESSFTTRCRVLLHERVKLVTHLGGLRWRSVGGGRIRPLSFGLLFVFDHRGIRDAVSDKFFLFFDNGFYQPAGDDPAVALAFGRQLVHRGTACAPSMDSRSSAAAT